MDIRIASLDDTTTISRLFQQTIARWQRITPDGYAEDVSHAQLTIYERWLHGGAWMSFETAAIWLNHLLRGAGMPIVVVDGEGQCQAYAEVFIQRGTGEDVRLHVAHFLVADGADASIETTLWQYLIPHATDYGAITMACSAYDTPQITRFVQQGMTLWRTVQQVMLPALTGQAFYKATLHTNRDISQINGWLMPIGDVQASRYYWESLWHDLWQAIPQIAQQQTHRLHLNASGQDAFVIFQQQLYDSRAADVYCWTPKPFSMQLLAAIRDWAHREGYRRLLMNVTEHVARIMGDSAEQQPMRHVVYRRLL